MNSVCVFCGANLGADPVFTDAARSTGQALAKRGLRLVYGGSNSGLMRVVADAALDAGGEVVGVMPRQALSGEQAYARLSELHRVDTMHARKAKMADLSDAFIALPGGFGTLDEILEMVNWTRLRIHAKPCGLLNVAGFYDRLVDFFDHCVAQGLLRAADRALLHVHRDPHALLDEMIR